MREIVLIGVLCCSALSACVDDTSPSGTTGITRDDETTATGRDALPATNGAAAPAPSIDDSVPVEPCQDPTPVVTPLIGTVNTIVVPANAGDFDVEVRAEPPAACPSDRVRFQIRVHNVTDHPSRFAPARGLLLASGGMAKFELAPLDAIELAAGERRTLEVVGTVPPVGPGTYRIGPEGITGRGDLVVLDPATAQTPSE